MIAGMLEFCHGKAVKTHAAYSGNQWEGRLAVIGETERQKNHPLSR